MSAPVCGDGPTTNLRRDGAVWVCLHCGARGSLAELGETACRQDAPTMTTADVLRLIIGDEDNTRGWPVSGRDPRIDPVPGDWLSNGRSDVVVDGFASNGDVLVRRFRAGEDEMSSAARLPLDLYRHFAIGAEVLAMGPPS